jgi:hypothetical protein
MNPSQFLFLLLPLCWYCTGASWLLQVVAYPTYHLVGEAEFVPFHVAFGRRLLPVMVVPMVLTNLAMFALPFYRPESVPDWLAWTIAACSAVIVATTALSEVPKHNQLDRTGKSGKLIDGLVRDNLPRTAAWTVASLLLAWALA